jgi:hypothetical protein
MEWGPMPARRSPPRLGEPTRRTTALTSAPRRRRDTTAVVTNASGKGWAKERRNCDREARNKRSSGICTRVPHVIVGVRRVRVVAKMREERSSASESLALRRRGVFQYECE